MSSNALETVKSQKIAHNDVDATKVQQLKLVHIEDFKRLHNVFPPPYTPKLEYVSPGASENLPLYPGRVLLGTYKDSYIYAVLRNLGAEASGFEIYLSNADDTAQIDMHEILYTAFQLEPWCSLVFSWDHQSMMKNWSDQIENITKLIMLESGYYDGKVTIDWDTICKAIIRNIDEGSFDPTSTQATQAAATTSKSSTRMQSRSTEAERSQKQGSLGLSKTAQSINNLPGTELASLYIQALRALVPYEIKTKEPGLVLVGKTPNEPFYVWAGLGQGSTEFANLLHSIHLNEVRLDEYFEYLCVGGILANGTTSRKTIVTTGIKAALIQDGYLTGAEFKLRYKPTNVNIRNLIKRNMNVLIGDFHVEEHLPGQGWVPRESVQTIFAPALGASVPALHAQREILPTPSSLTRRGEHIAPSETEAEDEPLAQGGARRRSTQLAPALKLKGTIPSNSGQSEILSTPSLLPLIVPNVIETTTTPLSRKCIVILRFRRLVSEFASLFPDTLSQPPNKKRKADTFLKAFPPQTQVSKTSKDAAIQAEVIKSLNARIAQLDHQLASQTLEINELKTHAQLVTVRGQEFYNENAELKKTVVEHAKELATLGKLKTAHVRYCQGRLMRKMVQKYESQGYDGAIASAKAKADYKILFGIDVEAEGEDRLQE